MSGGGSQVDTLKQDLRGKHYVVTGANTGLGYVTARELAKMGAKVTLACRNEDKGKAAVEKIREEALEKPVKEGVSLLEGLDGVDVNFELVDLGSLQSIIEFSQRFKASGAKVDALINNAGILALPERQETVDGYEMQIGVNYVGHHLLTRLMEPCIKDGIGRVVFLSSMGHRDTIPGFPVFTIDWDNLNYEKPGTYSDWEAYRRSKLANILDAKEFGKRLAQRGITTYAVHPGAIWTGLERHLNEDTIKALDSQFDIITPLEGSLTTLKCAIDPELGKPALSGRYWANLQEEKPSDAASDPANPPRYWEVMEGLLEAKLGKKVDDMIQW